MGAFWCFDFQGFEIASKLWLSAWASSREEIKEQKESDYQGVSNTDYITVYGILGLLQSLAFVTGILLMNRRTLTASLNVHSSIFHRVLHSTIDFVWTTPVGQVIQFLYSINSWFLLYFYLHRLPIDSPKIWTKRTSICQINWKISSINSWG